VILGGLFWSGSSDASWTDELCVTQQPVGFIRTWEFKVGVGIELELGLASALVCFGV